MRISDRHATWLGLLLTVLLSLAPACSSGDNGSAGAPDGAGADVAVDGATPDGAAPADTPAAPDTPSGDAAAPADLGNPKDHAGPPNDGSAADVRPEFSADANPDATADADAPPHDTAAGDQANPDSVPGPDLGAGDTAPPDAAPPTDAWPADLPTPDLFTPPDGYAYPSACDNDNTLVVCSETSPAPSGDAAIQAFVSENAFPLRCGPGADAPLDLGVLQNAYLDMRVFIFGEMHGSNEVGPLSAELFEALVLRGGVDTLVLEIGMDVTAALEEYVRTGDDSAGTPIAEAGFAMYSDKMFRRALPARAHALYERGVRVQVFGVDAPQRLAWVNEQLVAAAASLGSDEARALLLDTLPAAREMNSYGLFGIETAYVDAARAYHQHVVDNLEAICVGVDEAACTHIERLAFALYIGAVINSQDFMMAAMSGETTPEMMAVMRERETLIRYNFEQALARPDARVYAHMGAAHAAKGGWNVAAALQEEFAPTAGRVITTGTSYGPGSRIFYGIMTQDVPPEPAVVAAALADSPIENFFVPTAYPGRGCVLNPFLMMAIPELESSYGVAWDGLVYYRQLTPDVPEGLPWKSGGGWLQQFVRDQQWRMAFADRLLAAAR